MSPDDPLLLFLGPGVLLCYAGGARAYYFKMSEMPRSLVNFTAIALGVALLIAGVILRLGKII